MSTLASNIAFVQHHKPALTSGKYRLRIQQTLDDTGSKLSAQNHSLNREFFVAGERFHIQPQEIKGTYPPKNALGNYSRVFPHLVLNRTSLPWERQVHGSDTDTPWLGLLLIHEDEESDMRTEIKSLSDFSNASTSQTYYPAITLEPGQNGTDKVKVLDIKKSLLNRIVPNREALRLFTHIRRDENVNGQLAGQEQAVLVCPRLPVKGKKNTVFLVSLEHRFHSNGNLNYQGARNSDYIRLVELYSWSFTVAEHFKITQVVIDHIKGLASGDENKISDTVLSKLSALLGKDYFTEADFTAALTNVAQLTSTQLANNQAKIFAHFSYGDFAQIIRHLDRNTSTLCLPKVNDAVADTYLSMGFCPLPHKMRQGTQTVSWYHGPLAPIANAETTSLPAKASDELLRYYEAHGMLDVSYASAWELGRLLALQNTHYATGLYQWKRRLAKNLNKQTQLSSHGMDHLHGSLGDFSTEPMPDSVKDWLKKLSLLKGIPFNYLVPDERMLPIESIRFFQIDLLWMNCLLDGAMSIGRVSSKDHALDTQIRQNETSLLAQAISGFILRSELVSGWPGMQIEAYKSVPSGSSTAIPDADKLSLIRRDTLSENVLICLFEGDLQTLDFHLKPDTLHFGISEKSDHSGFVKILRDSQGQEKSSSIVDIPLDANQMLQPAELVSRISSQKTADPSIAWDNSTSANLALQMLEGVEQVRFLKAGS